MCVVPASRNSEGGEISFYSWHRVPYGFQARSIDTADFNRDGALDIVTLDGSLLVLLLGDNQGGFSLPSLHLRGGSIAMALVAHDFNEDGNPDVAVAYASGEVWFFTGDGRGRLRAAQSLPVPGSASALVASDFDADGAADLVVALSSTNTGAGAIQFLRNDGHGTFRLIGTPAPAGRNPRRLCAGDFDGDGSVDFAVTNGPDRAVTVLFGGAPPEVSATKTLPSEAPLGMLPSDVAAGDIDGDGRDDLLVANGTLDLGPIPLAGLGRALEADPVAQRGNGALFISSGDREFEPARMLPIDNTPQDVRIMAVNRDGRPDIAAGGFGGILELVANSNGDFVRGTPTGNSSILAFAGADLNGDGRIDFAAVNSATVDVFLRRIDGSLPSRLVVSTPPGFQYIPSSSVAADVNGDGIQDLLASTVGGGTVETFLGQGDGGFRQPITTPTDDFPSFLAAADFDGDGSLDLAVQTRTLDFFKGDGAGSFSHAGEIGDSIYGQVEAADFDGDGNLDLVAVARRFVPAPGFVGAEVFLGDGRGSFRRAASLESNEPTSGVIVHDVNADGRTDVVLLNARNLSLFLNTGGGEFTTAATISTPGSAGVAGAAIGDLDGDGLPDLAISTIASGIDRPFGPFWLRGDGQGHFDSPVHLAPEHFGLRTQGVFVGKVSIRDVNADGTPDIAVASSRGVTLFQNMGRAQFSGASPFFPLQQGCDSSCPLTIADLNGDGLPDLTSPSQSASDREGRRSVLLTVLFNNSPPERSLVGDADCDLVVTTRDLVTLHRRLFSSLHFLACAGADANGDGRLTAADLTAVTSLLAANAPVRSVNPIPKRTFWD
jgi:hypothetical protein